MVVLTSAWPSSSCTVRMSYPSSSRCVANSETGGRTEDLARSASARYKLPRPVGCGLRILPLKRGRQDHAADTLAQVALTLPPHVREMRGLTLPGSIVPPILPAFTRPDEELVAVEVKSCTRSSSDSRRRTPVEQAATIVSRQPPNNLQSSIGSNRESLVSQQLRINESAICQPPATVDPTNAASDSVSSCRSPQIGDRSEAFGKCKILR